jgi:two-component system LytT family response regulator
MHNAAVPKLIRVFVVDDEPAARRKLLRFLQDESGVQTAGEAGSGREAVERILAERPDLVFLDIHMPDMDGFEVVDALAQGGYVPAIVFATAHDDYAVRAFEVSALDYLLKPFDRERFQRALVRARKSVASGTEPDQAQLLTLLEALRPPGRYLRRLLVPHAGRSLFVNVAEIVRLESDRNEVAIHSRRGTYTLRATLDSMEQKLDPEQFVRIHRSHLVNLDAIREIHPWFHGDYKVVLHDGTELMWSRRFAAKRPDLVK